MSTNSSNTATNTTTWSAPAAGVVDSKTAREALRAVRTWHFNPLCKDGREACAWLLRGAPPCATAADLAAFQQGAASAEAAAAAATPAALAALEGHAVACSGTAYVCDGRSACLRAVPLHGIEASFFLSAVALGDAAAGIAERIDAEAHLQAYRGWDVEVVAAGDVFDVAMVDGGIACFVSTKKVGQYFDFVVYEGAKVSTYAYQTALAGVRHSGDIGSLLHYIRVDGALPLGQPHALGAVGYCRTKLRDFVNQVPAVCVPSPEERVIRIVPCPLDEASVGDNTMACFATVERLPNAVLRFAVAAAPVTVAGIDTNSAAERAAEADELVGGGARGQGRRRAPVHRRPLQRRRSPRPRHPLPQQQQQQHRQHQQHQRQ